MKHKRARGQFYTVGNPFALRAFTEWAREAGLPKNRILEPFAGANNIIRSLQQLGLCDRFAAYDIEPHDAQVARRDTLSAFPKEFDVCVTNPPWLARNSATRRNLEFPDTPYDDLYKHCLQLCLRHCKFVAALLPASYLQSELFRERLHTYTLLHDKTMFSDTDNPVCLALFSPHTNRQVNIYYDDEYIGTLAALQRALPNNTNNKHLRFNDPEGELGFISFDNTKEASIKFCHASEIRGYAIKNSSRFITRISGELVNVALLIECLNSAVKQFRLSTQDAFLTPFKGIRTDGRYRRRMEYALAKRFINAV